MVRLIGIVNHSLRCRGCHQLGVVEIWIENGWVRQKSRHQHSLCARCGGREGTIFEAALGEKVP